MAIVNMLQCKFGKCLEATKFMGSMTGKSMVYMTKATKIVEGITYLRGYSENICK